MAVTSHARIDNTGLIINMEVWDDEATDTEYESHLAGDHPAESSFAGTRLTPLAKLPDGVWIGHQQQPDGSWKAPELEKPAPAES